MTCAIVLSRATIGIEAPLVEVETHISNGLPKFSLVGLPETAVKESKERVRSALINSGFEFPTKRITINLAPADLPKEGGRFDLAIALSILLASKQITFDSKSIEFAAELSLNGKLRPVHGILPVAISCQQANHSLILDQANASQAQLVGKLELYSAHSLLEVVAHLTSHRPLAPVRHIPLKPPSKLSKTIDDVIGQVHAKRALTIAASGQHHLLMSGPPGTGKTMLASRLNSLLPPLTEQELLEKIALESLTTSQNKLSTARAFRQPHHTCSAVALVGGGSHPKPGEISLAHHGVLFLDELPEFNRHTLEVLREPLESGEIHITRVKAQVTFPAKFQLIAAMNPCPCGYWGDPVKPCQCTQAQIAQYRHRLSGPLLDRIDLHCQVLRLKQSELLSSNPLQQHPDIAKQVKLSREIQLARQGKSNALLSSQEIKTFCLLSPKLRSWFAQTTEHMGLSSRAVHKTLKVARTIADLYQAKDIEKEFLLESLSFRMR